MVDVAYIKLRFLLGTSDLTPSFLIGETCIEVLMTFKGCSRAPLANPDKPPLINLIAVDLAIDSWLSFSGRE